MIAKKGLANDYLMFPLTKDSSRSARYHMLPVVQLPDILTDISPTNTGMALHTHIVTNSQHHLRESVNERVHSFCNGFLPFVFVRLVLWLERELGLVFLSTECPPSEG